MDLKKNENKWKNDCATKIRNIQKYSSVQQIK